MSLTLRVAWSNSAMFRARLSCLSAVDGETVLGEALVKVPSEKAAKGKRPMIRL
jgi:hypothetical protein